MACAFWETASASNSCLC